MVHFRKWSFAPGSFGVPPPIHHLPPPPSLLAADRDEGIVPDIYYPQLPKPPQQYPGIHANEAKIVVKLFNAVCDVSMVWYGTVRTGTSRSYCPM